MSKRAPASDNRPASAGRTTSPDFEMPRYTKHEQLVTMCGVLLVMFLSALDSTIVSTAMPSIIADLHGFDRYTWVTTAYLLTSTVTVPLYGKLSDLLGRKPIFMFAVVIFLIGSALSGAAQSMNELIGFRGFQGIGAGGLISLAVAIVGDIFTPRERGKWQGVTGGVFGIASIVGPLVGGWLTEYASWHWVFYVNIPIGIAALLVLFFVMPTIRPNVGPVVIDYIGAVLLVTGTIPLLLALSWGGTLFPWISGEIIGLLVFSILVLTGFLLYEARLSRKGSEPILEPGLFKNRIFTISTIITVVTNMGLYGSVYFIPLFIQGIVGQSVTDSGLVLTPLMLASVLTSVLAGQLVSRLGRYKWIAITGMIITLIGAVLLVRLNVNSTMTNVIVAMVVLGLGLGASMSLYTLIVQNALPTKIGEASAALVFFRSIGSTFALGLMGSLMAGAYLPAFQRALPTTVKQAVPASTLAIFHNPQILLSPTVLTQVRDQFAAQGQSGIALFDAIIAAVKQGLEQGIHEVFLLSLALIAIGVITVFFLPEIELRGPASKRAAQEALAERGEPVAGHTP